MILGIIIAISLSMGLYAETPKNNCENVIELYLPQDSIFESDSEVFYYAYMDLNAADESLKEKILQARNIIISNSSWVADEIDGYIVDQDGNILEEVPRFSEIFPSDWELPVLSAPDGGSLKPQESTEN